MNPKVSNGFLPEALNDSVDFGRSSDLPQFLKPSHQPWPTVVIDSEQFVLFKTMGLTASGNVKDLHLIPF